MPSLRRRRMWKCSASSGSMPSVGSAPRRPAASSLERALGLEVGDQPLERIRPAVEDEIVGELALELRDLRVRRDVVRVDHREVEPGLHAVVQEHAVDRPTRAGIETPNETLETPSEVLHAGIAALIAAIPSIVSTALRRHSASPVVSVKVRQSKISSSGARPCSSQQISVMPLRDLELALRRSSPSRPRRSSARSAPRRGRAPAARRGRACRDPPRG